jgi:hypothetical protein
MNPKARRWSKVSAFKRDAIVAVLRRGGVPDSAPDDRPHGLAIKRELEIIRDEDVNHGRLYPNLDDLADAGLIQKGTRDRRTNTYHASNRAVECFVSYLTDYAGVPVHETNFAHLPRIAYDEQTSKERGSN